jgi:acyl carrier protein
MNKDYLNCKAGIKDIEEFMGIKVESNCLDINQPLESQGILDSLESMQFIIFLEKKYKQTLTQNQIESLKIYKDLIEKFN